METYLGKAKDLPPADKCEALEQSEGVAEKHEAAAQEGQTDAAEHSDVNAHFICITSCDGQLFELDGRKGIPINHGPTTPGVCALAITPSRCTNPSPHPTHPIHMYPSTYSATSTVAGAGAATHPTRTITPQTCSIACTNADAAANISPFFPHSVLPRRRPGSFLLDATKVCKEFMERDPDSVDFTIVALSKAP